MLPAAYQVHASVQVNPWSEASFAQSLNAPYFARALFSQDQLIGYAIVMLVAGEATLMDIGVMPDRQGKGGGKVLLEDCIAQCKKHAASELWLEVRESNHGAIALYHKFLFRRVDVRKNYYTTATGERENAQVMCRELN